MTAMAKVDVAVHCSFCGKPDVEVRKVIAGPGVYICDGCVELCNTILTTDDGSSRAQLNVLRSLTDEELLTQLPRVASVGSQVEAGLQERVSILRERKVTWTRIGAALGMARQSAWERFSREE